MQHNIYRGETLIGSIILPSESGAPVFGMEVLVTTAFPESDPEGDNQFASYERAERFLHLVYEAHCEAHGITAEPMPTPEPEIDEEAAYYARGAAHEQHDIEAQDAAMEPETAPVAAPVYPEPVVADEEPGDLPF